MSRYIAKDIYIYASRKARMTYNPESEGVYYYFLEV
jgi:hypothetical protein